MSHITSIDIIITDLTALKEAVTELGAQWVEDKRTYEWFGRSVGDYPIPEGMAVNELGKCDHVIRLPGCQYEIGVVRKGTGYTLAYDFWGPGAKLKQHFGDGLTKIKQLYAVEKAATAARAKGYLVTRRAVANGAIKLVITGC